MKLTISSPFTIEGSLTVDMLFDACKYAWSDVVEFAPIFSVVRGSSALFYISKYNTDGTCELVDISNDMIELVGTVYRCSTGFKFSGCCNARFKQTGNSVPVEGDKWRFSGEYSFKDHKGRLWFT